MVFTGLAKEYRKIALLIRVWWRICVLHLRYILRPILFYVYYWSEDIGLVYWRLEGKSSTRQLYTAALLEIVSQHVEPLTIVQ